MPKAVATRTTSRRGLLAAASLLTTSAALPAAALPAHPDAELLDLARDVMDLDRQLDAMGAGMSLAEMKASGTEAAQDALHDRQAELAERAIALRSTTLDGLRAKAHVAAVYRPLDEPEEYLSDRCRTSLVHDLIGWAA